MNITMSDIVSEQTRQPQPEKTPLTTPNPASLLSQESTPVLSGKVENMNDLLDLTSPKDKQKRRREEDGVIKRAIQQVRDSGYNPEDPGWQTIFDLSKHYLIFMVENALAVLPQGRTIRDDLLQEGTISIMQAVKKFDSKAPNLFLTFASPWIKGAVYRAIIEQAYTIGRPVYVIEDGEKIEPLIVQHEIEHPESDTSTPAIEEIMKRTKLSRERVENYMKSRSTTLLETESLEQRNQYPSISRIPASEIHDPYAEHAYERIEHNFQELTELLAKNHVPQDDINMIILRYVDEASYPEIREILGIGSEIQDTTLRTRTTRILQGIRDNGTLYAKLQALVKV